MSKEEKEVLKTFKSGLGLTGAEQEILSNYIDKQQKVIDLMADKLIEYELYEYDATIKRKWKKKTIEYFYKKAEEEK